MKFSAVGRQHLAESYIKLREKIFCRLVVAVFATFLRALLLKVAAGERTPPELSRIILAGCLKAASLKAVKVIHSFKKIHLRIITALNGFSR